MYNRLAYIEENMKKRRGDRSLDDELEEERPWDPHEELFKIDDRYRAKPKTLEEEGNVTNSLAMLTAIPEVDLGMEWVGQAQSSQMSIWPLFKCSFEEHRGNGESKTPRFWAASSAVSTESAEWTRSRIYSMFVGMFPSKKSNVLTVTISSFQTKSTSQRVRCGDFTKRETWGSRHTCGARDQASQSGSSEYGNWRTSALYLTLESVPC